MAVCMVCLLCVDHFPCKGHITDNHAKEISLKSYKSNDRSPHPSPQMNHFHESFPSQYESRRGRIKRHAGHLHTGDTSSSTNNKRLSENSNTEKFLDQIFDHYGSSTSKTMTLKDFEKMLVALGMNKLVRDSRPTTTTAAGEQCKADSYSLVMKMSHNPPLLKHEHHTHEVHDDEHDHYHHPNGLEQVDDHEHDHKKVKQEQRSTDLSLDLSIDTETIWNICPVLLYQLTAPSQSERSGCIETELLDSVVQQHAIPSDEYEEERGLVWIYSTIAVLGVSLCGLLGVAVIPCMDKHFYHHTLQFFVALAVGTLCGDALLHLLPHVSITFTIISHSTGPLELQLMEQTHETSLTQDIFTNFSLFPVNDCSNHNGP